MPILSKCSSLTRRGIDRFSLLAFEVFIFNMAPMKRTRQPIIDDDLGILDMESANATSSQHGVEFPFEDPSLYTILSLI